MRRLILTSATALLASLLFAAPAWAEWVWPLRGEVITPYRNGDDPYASGQHRGIDIAGHVGAAVVAAAGGEVRFAGAAGSSGLTVSVRTSDGRYDTSYLHLGSTAVREGDRIAAGDRIGSVGTTGVRTVAAPHLHFGVRDAGSRHAYHDPLTFLPPPPTTQPPRETPAPQPAPIPVGPAPAPVQAPAGRRIPVRAPAGRRLPVRAPAPQPIRAPARAGVPERAPDGRRTPAPLPNGRGVPVRTPGDGRVPAHTPGDGRVSAHAPGDGGVPVRPPAGRPVPVEEPAARRVPADAPAGVPMGLGADAGRASSVLTSEDRPEPQSSSSRHEHPRPATMSAPSGGAGAQAAGPGAPELPRHPGGSSAPAGEGGTRSDPDIGLVLACLGLLAAAVLLGLTDDGRKATRRAGHRVGRMLQPLLGRR